MATVRTKPVLSLQKNANNRSLSSPSDSNKQHKYIDGLDKLERDRYEQKLSLIKGQDPYEIVLWSGDHERLPNINYINLVNYLVFKTSAYTGEQLDCYKGLDAYNQFVCGWVRDVGSCSVDAKIIVTAKVLHSQRLNEKPLRLWIIAEEDGRVLAGHCTCMAGLGETCTHVAALLFYIQAANDIRERKTVTSKPAYWKLPSAFQRVSYAELRSIDFTSASTLKRQFEASINTNQEPETPKPVRKIITPPDADSVRHFLKRLSESGSKPVILSILPDYADRFIPDVLQGDLPTVLTELKNDEYETLAYDELLRKCDLVSVKVSKQQSDHVEAITRDQSSNRVWYRFRSGRITASRMKPVCHTNPDNPSQSLIKLVCYPENSKFQTKATKWGCSHEKLAREMFLEVMSQGHDNVSFTASGFVISPDMPHIGASPDGMVTCDCCGTSPVEIKCPFCERGSVLSAVKDKNFCLKADIEGNLKLDRTHQHYYQVQTQLGVCQLERAFFVVWTEKDLHVEEILFDMVLWKEMCEKSTHFFRTAVLPELLGRFYSRQTAEQQSERTTRLPTEDAPCDDNDVISDQEIFTAQKVYCYCLDIEFGSMVECENPDCKHKWFHFKCVGIRKEPKGHWFCPDCRKLDCFKRGRNSNTKKQIVDPFKK